MRLPRGFGLIFFTAALALALWRAPQPAAPVFVAPPAPVKSELPAEFAAELLPVAAPSAHAVTLAELPDGRIAAAWFAGAREGAADVAVWFSIRDGAGQSLESRSGPPPDPQSQTSLARPSPLKGRGEQLPAPLFSLPFKGRAGEGMGERYSEPSIIHALAPRDGVSWSPPRQIATRSGTAEATFAHVRKLGNPVLFVDGQRLHLWFVSAALGGWAGSSINHSVSDDGGSTWSPASKLVTSPFLNISTLVRTPPLALADGGLGLPVYHEFIAKHGEWLRLAADGRILDKMRLPQTDATLQPAAVALDGQRALAWLRDAGPGPGHIRAAETLDAGQHWLEAPATPLPNPNSSIAALRLPSGRLLLAGNPADGRQSLLLWLSADAGKTWKLVRQVEGAAEADAEFSYPALLLARDGRIHMAWTWKRQGIKHAAFSEAWLEGGAP